MKHYRFLLWVLIGATPLTLLANPKDLSKGWDYFRTNDLKNARKHFELATKSESTKAEAFLMLSILDGIDRTSKESFEHFAQFFQSSSDPYPFVFARWSTESLNWGRGKMTKEQLAFFQQLADNPKAPGTIKAMARSALGSHYEEVGDFKKANAHYDQIGSVVQWQITGEFENISASGFNKNYDPVTKPKSTDKFTNRSNAPIAWFNLPGYRHDRWIDFTYHFFTANSIIYAQTFVTSPKSQEVQLRVGTSGSLKVWLNDVLLFEEREERDNDLDTYIVTAKLNSGNNRILIQIGASESNRSNFLLRVTDDQGNNIGGLQFSPRYLSYKAAATFTPEHIPVFAEAYFEERIKKEPDNLLNYLMLADAYLRNDKGAEARHILNDAHKLAPDCSYIVWMLSDVFLRENVRTELSRSLEWLKDNDPDNPGTLELLWTEQTQNKDDWDAAAKTLEKLEKIFGIDEGYYQKKIEIAEHYDRTEEVFNLIDEAYAKFPDSYQFVLLKYYMEKEARGKASAAAAVLKKYLKSNHSANILKLQADDYFNQGNVPKGLAIYESLPAVRPYAVGLYGYLYDIYLALTNYTKAMQAVDDMIRLAPYVGAYWAKKGAIYEAQKNDKKAIESYEKCLVYQPTNYDAREKLRTLKTKPDVWSYFTDEDVYEVYKRSPNASEYPEDNSLILLDNTRKVIHGNGASEMKATLLVKTFNASGVDAWKDYYVPVYAMQDLLVEKAEVIKPTGAKIEAQRSYSRIIFNNLEVGDAIHITYRVQDYRTGKLANHFWDKVYFSRFYPYLKMRYSVLASPDYRFRHQYSNGTLEVMTEKKDEFKLHVWEKENQPSIKHEPYMPALADIGEMLIISTFDDWKWISDWYSDLAKEKAKSDFEVKEVVQELFPEDDLDDRTKAQRIYEYIVKNVRYSSIPFRQSGLIPQKASSVINSKIGDCKDVSTLFVALANEVGVDAKLVLVNTRDYGDLSMPLPSIDFNHCIAKVTLDEEPYYVELTSDFLAFSTFNRILEKAFVLEIDPASSEVSSEPFYLFPATRLKNITDRTSTLTLETNGDLQIVKHTTRTGYPASSMRRAYRDLGDEARKKRLMESLSSEFPNITLKDYTFTKGLETVSDSIVYTFEYSAKDVLSEVGAGMRLLKLPWSGQIKSTPEFLSLDKRTYDIDFWQYSIDDAEVEVMQIIIPPALRLVELPKAMNYSSSVADYSLKFERKGNTITATRKMTYKKDHDKISVKEYEAMRDFFAKVVKADKTQLAFR